MSGTFLDRVLARLDGAVACIWNTDLVELDAPVDEARLRAALDQLGFARLHQRWTGREWSGHHEAYTLRRLPPAPPTEALDQLINDPIDLRSEPPLRVTLIGDTHLALQLHHAAGDGRSFAHLHLRLGALYQGSQGEPPLDDQLGRRRLARALAGGIRCLPTQLDPASRLLARRGHALHHRGGEPGRVRVHALSVAHGDLDPAGLFFATLLAAAARWDPRATRPIRLRVPVDLRPALGLAGLSIENASSAMPVEVTRDELKLPPRELIALVPARIRAGAARGEHLASLATLLVAERLSSDAAMRRHVRPDLTADPRSNTLVTTYLGSVDRLLSWLPARRTWGHTPTWGAVGFRFRGRLHLFFSAFDGLWTRQDLADFAGLGASWLEGLGLDPREEA